MASETKHPWYGPCDAFGPNDTCSECSGQVERAAPPTPAQGREEVEHATVEVDARCLVNDFSELTRPEIRRLARAYLALRAAPAEAEGEWAVAFARGLVNEALRAMSISVHGTPSTSMYVEDLLRKASAALSAPTSPRKDADATGLDSRATVLAHLRGEVKPHLHGEYGCDCGPEEFGLSEEMADAIAAHRDRVLASSPRAGAAGEVTEAWDRARRYVGHRNDDEFRCREHRDGPGTCDCGLAGAFDAMVAALRAARGGGAG